MPPAVGTSSQKSEGCPGDCHAHCRMVWVSKCCSSLSTSQTQHFPRCRTRALQQLHLPHPHFVSHRLIDKVSQDDAL